MHKIACHRCGDGLEGWVYTRRFGEWDADTQRYDGHNERHLCQECWNDREGRERGAHYYPDSAAELWAVLAAADGNLAATLTWWTGRPSIRIVDGEPEAAVTKPHHGGYTEDGRGILDFRAELIDGFDRETFDDIAAVPDKDQRGLVFLESPERTSFAGVDADD